MDKRAELLALTKIGPTSSPYVDKGKIKGDRLLSRCDRTRRVTVAALLGLMPAMVSRRNLQWGMFSGGKR